MGEALREPVTEPAAWEAAELAADPTWVHHWTDAELRELESVGEGVLNRGLPVIGFSKADIEAPLLGARCRWMEDQLENGRGIVWLRGLNPDAYPEQKLRAMYWALGVTLGIPKPQNAEGDLIGEVRDRGVDYNKISSRGYTTNAKLYFHCDGLDLVSLLCLRPSKSGGESRITSSLAIFNEILRTHPEYLPLLEQGFFYNLRGEGITGAKDEVTKNRIPVFSYHEGRLSCRYLRKVIKEGQQLAGEPVEGLAAQALDYIQELGESPRFCFDMDFAPGDIQILNNYVTLHSRNGFEDYEEPERKRCLLRMWMNLETARPLAPAFADRYNNGPREGIRLKKDRVALS